MPYARNSELPNGVRDRYTERCQTVFRRVFNEAIADGRKESDAFAIAHSAGKNCMDATSSTKAVWSTAYINNLPDAAFAYIEPGGEKDDEGKTTPRSLRHFPHHDADGSIDLPHLRNALSRGPQSDVWPKGKGHLEQHAEEAGVGDNAKSLETEEVQPVISAVKFAEGSEDIIEGLGIPFGGPFAGKDLHGDAFGPDTDFCLDWFEKRPLLYEHGQDEKLQHSKIGEVIGYDVTDDGVWVRSQLDKRSRYYGVVKKLIDANGLGYSAGALDYLIKGSKSDPKHATRWPWIEQSLTPIPANPLAGQIAYAVKSAEALAHFEEAGIDMPEPVKAALTALDEWAIEQTEGGSEPEPLADQSERVLAGLKAWVERVEERSIHRAKVGRELSKANIETLREAYRIIGGLIERSERPSEEEQRETEARKAFAEYARLEAELLGVKPG